MTRSRFIKLLQSYGYSRNEAEAEVIEVQLPLRPWSYAERYSYMKSYGVLWKKKTGRAFRTAIKKINRSMYNVARALAESAAPQVNGRKNDYDTKKGLRSS